MLLAISNITLAHLATAAGRTGSSARSKGGGNGQSDSNENDCLSHFVVFIDYELNCLVKVMQNLDQVIQRTGVRNHRFLENAKGGDFRRIEKELLLN